MMLRIFVAFEITNLAMFLGMLAVIAIKESMYVKRTNDLYRFNRFNDYLDERWPEFRRKSSFTRTITNALVLLGLRSVFIINEYYNFLDYDAEQLKKEEG